MKFSQPMFFLFKMFQDLLAALNFSREKAQLELPPPVVEQAPVDTNIAVRQELHFIAQQFRVTRYADKLAEILTITNQVEQFYTETNDHAGLKGFHNDYTVVFNTLYSMILSKVNLVARIEKTAYNGDTLKTEDKEKINTNKILNEAIKSRYGVSPEITENADTASEITRLTKVIDKLFVDTMAGYLCNSNNQWIAGTDERTATYRIFPKDLAEHMSDTLYLNYQNITNDNHPCFYMSDAPTYRTCGVLVEKKETLVHRLDAVAEKLKQIRKRIKDNGSVPVVYMSYKTIYEEVELFEDSTKNVNELALLVGYATPMKRKSRAAAFNYLNYHPVKNLLYVSETESILSVGIINL